WLWWSSATPQPQVPAVGSILHDCPDCPELVVVPDGRFEMGSPVSEAGRDSDEGPVHTVTVPARLAVGRYPVTRGEYQRFIAAKGARPAGCTVLKNGIFTPDPETDWSKPGFEQTDTHPVTCVSWQDARDYAAWLAETTGKPYRLLTEAEWEYAARGGTTTPWFWGTDPGVACQHANLADRVALAKVGIGGADVLSCEDGFAFTSPVTQFPANGFRLYDMAGNLFQWVADCYRPDYSGASGVATESRAEANCSARLIRGGAWTSPVRQARSGSRVWEHPEHRGFNIGFRVARDLNLEARHR
ncbi:MAG: formylglycine-generating enzyme family protein, partial [Alphaproteobacteria bacterium]|nr:formylglycine-generating enzyme family protein [Alphaproteobacteria bacterium]